jgi:hypothetical protein
MGVDLRSELPNEFQRPELRSKLRAVKFRQPEFCDKEFRDAEFCDGEFRGMDCQFPERPELRHCVDGSKLRPPEDAAEFLPENLLYEPERARPKLKLRAELSGEREKNPLDLEIGPPPLVLPPL